uniref:Uncharacterized protein n=1 Tax=viral metagenome TaxID=1070528 RepID=A0A6M3IYW1_9ZZZZ
MKRLWTFLVNLACLIAALSLPLVRAIGQVVVRPIVAALKAPPTVLLLLWRAAGTLMIIVSGNATRTGPAVRSHLDNMGIRCTRPARHPEGYASLARKLSTGLPTLGMCNAG